LHFKLEWTVRELTIQADNAHVFNYSGPHRIVVSVRRPSSTEQSIGHDQAHAFCTTSSVFEPNEGVRTVFAKIAANEIIPADATQDGIRLEYTTPDMLRIRLPGLSGFDQPFRSFLKTVHDELADHAIRTISVLRWRTSELGPHDPISTRGLSWSVDGGYWHPAPMDTSLRMVTRGLLRVSEQQRLEVEAMVANGLREPLHHDLFREAWEQRDGSPRSAIVIGMASVEIAAKRCIATLAPAAEWLAINLPTPPLIRILKEYLPLLPARCTFDERVPAPPKALLDILNKGVTIRNQLSHVGTPSPRIEDVEAILQAAHDVLWLIDYYSGTPWAAEHLRPETRAELSAA
jgi:hypothetical protein